MKAHTAGDLARHTQAMSVLGQEISATLVAIDVATWNKKDTTYLHVHLRNLEETRMTIRPGSQAVEAVIRGDMQLTR